MFKNDHGPAHVHVFGQGGEAKILLEGPNDIRLDWTVGISRGDLRRLIQEIRHERVRLITAWKTIHEDDS